MALTLVYLVAIFPLAYSDQLTLKYLWRNPAQIENMFWYVFGTFTNSLTFQGERSWSNSKKSSTRILIGESLISCQSFLSIVNEKQLCNSQGFYWVFTIIITACYTGSIIAFVTLPVFPETVDTIHQLNSRFYRVGTLDRGGWERWFLNSTDKITDRLIKRLENVRTLEEGLGNVTKPFFLFPYAFLGSSAQLEYIIKTDYTGDKISKRSALHVSDQCFVLYGVSMAFQMHSVYREKINGGIMELQQSGLLQKITRDIQWDFYRSASGLLLQVSPGKTATIKAQEERGLTLADTEGMFLLLAIGFVIAGSALVSEWVGGCTNKCIRIVKTKREKEKTDRDEQAEREEQIKRKVDLAQGTLDGAITVIGIKTKVGDGADDVDGKSENGSKSARSDLSAEHSRSSSIVAYNDLSPSMLREMYEGPAGKHSNVIMFNGKLMTESQAAKQTRPLTETTDNSYERKVSETFDFLKSQDEQVDLSSEDGGENSDEGVENCQRAKEEQQTVRVEINAATPVNSSDDVDNLGGVFGEKVDDACYDG